jgi:hypothetical protein
MPVVQLLEQRTFDPPRCVEVEYNDRWWPASQSAWRLCNDGRGWMADCSWTEQHDWGPGRYLMVVPPDRIRLI